MTKPLLTSLCLTLAIHSAVAMAADPLRIPLTPTPLSEQTYINTPASLIDSRASSNVLRFEKGTTTLKFAIGQLPLSLTFTAPDTLTLTTPEQTMVLKKWPKDRCGRQPVELRLPNGKPYTLAFSHAHISPDDQHPTEVYYTSGTLLTGTVNSTPIALYDSNTDGRYTTDDIIRLGSPSKDLASYYDLFTPLSKVIYTPTALYEIQSLADDGSALTLLPYSSPTARLQLDTAPPLGLHAILTSPDAQLNLRLDTKPKASSPVSVLPGSYQLLAGTLFIADGSFAGLVKPGSLPPLKVTPDAPQSLTFSGPASFAFSASLLNNRTVNIKPESFRFTGKLGEEYARLRFDTAKPPEVTLALDGKSITLGKMAFG